MLVLWAINALASPKLNELMYDRSGDSDAYKEWVELCDYDDDPTDLTGWQLQYAGQDWEELYIYGPESIAPGDHLVHGGTDFVAGMWNAETATAGLRLVDADGTVIDTILYGPNNLYELIADDGTSTSAPAPDVPEDSDQSLGRYPDCADTDDSSLDVVVFALPTDTKRNRDPDGEKPDSDEGEPGKGGCGGASGEGSGGAAALAGLVPLGLRRRASASATPVAPAPRPPAPRPVGRRPAG